MPRKPRPLTRKVTSRAPYVKYRQLLPRESENLARIQRAIRKPGFEATLRRHFPQVSDTEWNIVAHDQTRKVYETRRKISVLTRNRSFSSNRALVAGLLQALHAEETELARALVDLEKLKR